MNENSYFQRELKKPLSRTIRVALITNLKSERAWIFCLLIPFAISFIIIYAYSTYSSLYRMLPPQLLTTFLTSPIFVGCYFSVVISEWRGTYLLKRMKFVEIRGWQVVVALLVTSILFSLISSAFNVVMVMLVSKAFHTIEFQNVSNLFAWNWVWFFFDVILITTIAFLISIIGTNLLKGKQLGISFCMAVALFGMLFSDIVIPSFSSSRNDFLTYFGYINIFKYGSWLMLLVTSFSFVDYQGGIQQVISDPTRTNTHVFINNIYGCLVILLAAIAITLFFAIKTFKWKE